MNFGTVTRVLLFGGGQMLYATARFLAEWGKETHVISSARHAGAPVEVAEGEFISLDQAIRALGVAFGTAADIAKDEAVLALAGPRVLGLSISAEWIFKRDLINRFGCGLLNIHGTALPLFGGGGGASWWALMGEREGGVTLHLVDPAIDAGDIVVQRTFAFPEGCRTPADYDRVKERHGVDMLRDFFAAVERGGDFSLRTQDPGHGTYWPRLRTLEHGFIDWRWSASEIVRFICAFDKPYAGASTYVDSLRVFLKDCAVVPDCGPFHPFQRGLVFRKSDDALTVAANDGAIVVRSVRSEEDEDVMGKVRPGFRLYTPESMLERALQYRAVYKPTASRPGKG